jgi:hypothetical protein
MTRLTWQSLKLSSLVEAPVGGFLAALASGLVENTPEASIIGAKHYGYPLAWRVDIISLTSRTDFNLSNLVIDMAFWIASLFIALVIIEKIVLPELRAGFDFRKLVLPLVLFIPMGLVMDLIHESGHAFWGSAVGGTLSYMQVAYLVVYPRVAITPQFCLGCVEVSGIATSLGHGLFLLGGSVTTNIVAWLLGPFLLKRQFRRVVRVSLGLLGLFGLLDLPFYILFPQMGLQHWIVLGGKWPEPLIGAREAGIPDPIFYAGVILTTLGLFFLYVEPLRGLVLKKLLYKQKK